ncbi:MAG: TlpA family protein disulfide reductase [Gammaproteobacteria bacterium]|nr:TlpA family protein disulfide reductase [Gammaproteobacteria bacterium]MCW9031755.1 TlpA family protein disulfide reductase [Gammaproteobacteria bacterium]
MSHFQLLKNITLNKIAIFSFITFLFLPFSVSAEIKGFEDFSGKPQVFENYLAKGKWLVVMMWASDCHICNREAHQYVDFHMLHSDSDATVLGMSLDGASRKKEAEAFIKKHSVDFPNLIAEPATVAQLFQESTGQGFAGTPTFLIYSPDGELKAAQAGAVPTELIEDFIKKNSVKKVLDNN